MKNFILTFVLLFFATSFAGAASAEVIIYDPFAEEHNAQVYSDQNSRTYQPYSPQEEQLQHQQKPEENQVPKAIEWSGRVNFGGTVTDGNTQAKAFTLDGEATRRDEKNRYHFGAELAYEEDEGDETENEYMVYAEYDRFLTRKTFAGSRLSYEVDKIAKLDSRIKIGPYIGHQYYESEDLNLSTRLGVDYVNEEFESGLSNDDIALNWGVDYDQRVLDELIQIFYKHDLNIPFDDLDAFLYNGKTGVRFPVAKVLTGTAQIDFDWDNNPPIGVKENDTKYALKLGYEF